MQSECLSFAFWTNGPCGPGVLAWPLGLMALAVLSLLGLTREDNFLNIRIRCCTQFGCLSFAFGTDSTCGLSVLALPL